MDNIELLKIVEGWENNNIYKLGKYKLIKERKFKEAKDPLCVLLEMNKIVKEANKRRIQL